jgi:hypothetical protein
MKYLFAVFFASSIAGAACTDYPAQHDLQKLEYRLDKIGSSLKVVLEFPKLSTHASCTTTAVQWGTMWEFAFDITDPVQVKVTDLNGVVVQQFALYGPMELKVTSNRAAFRFYNSLTSKKVLDHHLRVVELANDSPLFPLPDFEFEDAGTVRHILGTKTIR